jgi:hypothetical protein
MNGEVANETFTLWSLGSYLLIVLGTGIVLWAARLQWRGPDPDAVAPAKPLDMVRSLRAVLVGGALVGLGVGLLWDNRWIIGISLIIGLEELLETSVVVMALRDEKARQETEKTADKSSPDVSD